MAYFPFFMDLSRQSGLVVGGGAVALRKIQALLAYGARLTVCALEVLPKIGQCPDLTLLLQPFEPALLDGADYVVAATDSPALNHQISELCRQRSIPVNVADDRNACTFLFPALVKRGELSIGISTGGGSPSAAIFLKQQISALLPEDFGPMLAYLERLREELKAALPEECGRARLFSRLFHTCMQSGWPLSETQLQEIILEFSQDGGECL